jgi:MFS transporter, DHA2 family, multidrug resistance protein
MSSVALTIDQDVWRPKYKPWLIAVVGALAAFMEVLDTSIANAGLQPIAQAILADTMISATSARSQSRRTKRKRSRKA